MPKSKTGISLISSSGGVSKNYKNSIYTIEEKFDPEVLIRNGFYYDKGDTNYYCKDFKTHTVCIDKKFGVHFYAENMEKFLSDIKDREERWKLRFKKMGIAVKKFEEPEEYE